MAQERYDRLRVYRNVLVEFVYYTMPVWGFYFNNPYKERIGCYHNNGLN
jgi:hypothetical protein